MSDLEAVRKILNEHRTVEKHAKLVGDSMGDFEALLTMRRAGAGWSQSSVNSLVESQTHLREALAGLASGLRLHFEYEEKVLPPILGKTLTKALNIDHQEIRLKLVKAEALATSTKLEGLSRENLLNAKGELTAAIMDMQDALEKHSTAEEHVLSMLEKALQSED